MFIWKRDLSYESRGWEEVSVTGSVQLPAASRTTRHESQALCLEGFLWVGGDRQYCIGEVAGAGDHWQLFLDLCSLNAPWGSSLVQATGGSI